MASYFLLRIKRRLFADNLCVMNQSESWKFQTMIENFKTSEQNIYLIWRTRPTHRLHYTLGVSKWVNLGSLWSNLAIIQKTELLYFRTQYI